MDYSKLSKITDSLNRVKDSDLVQTFTDEGEFRGSVNSFLKEIWPSPDAGQYGKFLLKKDGHTLTMEFNVVDHDSGLSEVGMCHILQEYVNIDEKTGFSSDRDVCIEEDGMPDCDSLVEDLLLQSDWEGLDEALRALGFSHLICDSVEEISTIVEKVFPKYLKLESDTNCVEFPYNNDVIEICVTGNNTLVVRARNNGIVKKAVIKTTGDNISPDPTTKETLRSLIKRVTDVLGEPKNVGEIISGIKLSDSKKVKDTTQYPVEGTRSDRMNYVANELAKLGIHMVDGHVDHIDNPELLKIQELLKGCKRCSLALFANDSGISAKVNIQDSLKGKVKDDKGADTEELTTLFNEIEKASENHSMSYEENVEEFIKNYADGETYLSVYVDELEYDDDEESYDFEEDWNKNHSDSGFEAYYMPIDYTTGRMYFKKK